MPGRAPALGIRWIGVRRRDTSARSAAFQRGRDGSSPIHAIARGPNNPPSNSHVSASRLRRRARCAQSGAKTSSAMGAYPASRNSHGSPFMAGRCHRGRPASRISMCRPAMGLHRYNQPSPADTEAPSPHGHHQPQAHSQGCHPGRAGQADLHLCRGQRADAQPARRQGRRSGRDDERRPARAARLHHHHRGLQRLLRGRQGAAAGPVGRRAGPYGRPGAGDGQGLRRPEGPAAGQRALGGGLQHAGHDGHGPQPGPQRAHRQRPHRADRQRALRLRRLAPLRGHVRPDRARHPGHRVRRAVRRAQAQARRLARHRPHRRRPEGHRRQVPRARPERRPASRSRPIRTGSWSSPSGPSSTRGSASAPTTTASSTRSRTTWAPR